MDSLPLAENVGGRTGWRDGIEPSHITGCYRIISLDSHQLHAARETVSPVPDR